MTLMRAAVLRPGDWVRYDGADHQVIALAGTSVQLRSEHGAESDEVAAVITFLCSDDASYLTGTTIDNNGGSHIH